MFVNGEAISDPCIIVNNFADYFKSVYTVSLDNNYSANMTTNNNILLPKISEDDILRQLRRAKNSMTSECDGIPSFLLRDCAFVFSAPLFHIFNLILESSTFPSVWKVTHISPVLKKGDPNKIENYRPISILCNFSKIFESILYSYIYKSVKNLISPHQHGFMENRSTITNLATLTQFISEALNRRSQVDVIYTDFQKAFDQIDHYILLSKLNTFGFSDSLVSLIKSYLFHRRQRVRYNNFLSNEFITTSGVPQGSNLGPLIFLLYINDLADLLNQCSILLFADDLKLYMEINSFQDSEILQECLKTLNIWCDKNRLQLNLAKCCVVSFTKKQNIINYPYEISNSVLNRVITVKDLGITFDAELSFNFHVREIVDKALKSYGFIYRNGREFTNIKILRILYFAFVRSRLEYGALIWNPIYNTYVVQLENVQRRFLKYLAFLSDGVYPIQGVDEQILLDRSQAKFLIAKGYSEYVKSMEDTISHDPRKFWTFIQTKRGKSRIPGTMFVNGEAISDPCIIVNNFADYFKSVYTVSLDNNYSANMTKNNNILLPKISEDDILRQLRRAKNSMTSGCDGIPSFLLRDCAFVFSAPLFRIFNLILESSTFPSVWKVTHICPVLKKGDPNKIENYRPISILCNFSKIFESILYSYIYKSVKNLISPHQHGFMENRSTITNLATLTQFISEALNRRSQVDVIYTDFQKAFDQIDHYILLSKLNTFGFSDSLVSLTKSYLFHRRQRVRYNNFLSNEFITTSGVPQGSNLGPLIFLLYINDLADLLNQCSILLFADDLKLYMEINSFQDSEILQECLKTLNIWCDKNRLQLNLAKCCVVSFTKKQNIINYPYEISNSVLNRVITVKDLGITFDAEFSFNFHV
ncbi:hypothetical protein TcasGA2_TC030943 [Tribolium castaneum]|uniref:Reverse transcriptase domain-containing protein n=1 Tax=Tribolium castaneum TaxID=7070 RepID=A0A139W9M8_TRICA|nr:hypothetical protein TcasGA2_TC030943 [Tribolium castaneum]